ncbi:MAG: diguanylate cyclase [Thermoleophilia bacterium]
MTADDLVIGVYAAAVTGCVAVAAVSWRRRAGSWAARPLAFGMAVCALYAAAALAVALMMRAGPAPGDALFTVTLSSLLLWSSLLGAACWCLCRVVADAGWRPRRRVLAVLAVQPSVTAAAVATDPWLHGVLEGWRAGHGDVWPRWTAGPLFWPLSAVTYAVALSGLAVLLRAMVQSRGIGRRQSATVLLAALLPGAGGLATAVLLADRNAPDLTPACMAATGVLTAYALFRQGALRLVPVARSRVMDHLADGVLVLDRSGRVLDMNPAARRLLVPGTRGLPHALEAVAEDGADGVAAGGVPSGEYPVDRPDGGLVIDVRAEPMDDGHGRPVGTVVVMRDVTESHTQRVRLAEANASLTAQIQTIDRLRGELAEQAVRDPLTGLHNRRYLNRALTRALDVAAVRGSHLSLVVLDLDHFKAVNDTHGHDVGDAVLVAAAEALRAGVRASDTLVRFGGEEFLVLLPGAGPDIVVERAEQLRLRCLEVAVAAPTGTVRVTASAGVATARPGDTPATLVKAADEALYRAKAAGRNRLMLAA